MILSWKNLLQLTDPVLQTAFFCVSSGTGRSLTEVVLIAERKSANMSLQQQKNLESSNNLWSG